jgi:hypothetical protein
MGFKTAWKENEIAEVKVLEISYRIEAYFI